MTDEPEARRARGPWALRYFDAVDPVSRASNRLSLVLIANQPTYPLLVGWVTGDWSPLLILALVSTPFFCAVPWVSRRFGAAGRLSFPALGALNTVLCTVLLGRGSGVEAFLAPCLVIVALSCPPGNRAALGASIAFLYVTFVIARVMPLGPMIVFGSEQLEALVSLNAYSAASFSAFAVWTLRGAQKNERARDSHG